MAEFVLEGDPVLPLNVLLVEDDDGDALAVKRAFVKAKIANPLVRAVDGVEALEIMRGENSDIVVKAPYIMLVDLNLPRMNGLQLVKEMRSDPALKNTVVFILTTSKSGEDKTMAYDLNVAGYIVKETAGKDFLELASMIGSYWKLVSFPGA